MGHGGEASALPWRVQEGQAQLSLWTHVYTHPYFSVPLAGTACPEQPNNREWNLTENSWFGLSAHRARLVPMVPTVDPSTPYGHHLLLNPKASYPMGWTLDNCTSWLSCGQQKAHLCQLIESSKLKFLLFS